MQAWASLKKNACAGKTAKAFCSYFCLGKKEILALAVILIFVLLFFKPTVSGDGYGYYTILEGVFYDHTLNFERQMRFFGAPQELYSSVTHKYVSKYAFGFPIFCAPLYLVSLGLDNVSALHFADSFFIKESGDTLLHQLPVGVITLIFLALAMLFTSKILADFFGFKERWFILLLTYFATPITFYSTYGVSFSHVAEAGLFSVMLFYALSNKKVKTGVLSGLLFITRYSAGVFLLPLLAQDLLGGGRKNLSFKLKSISSPLKVLLAFLPFAIAAMLWFLVQFGSPFNSGYESFESVFPIHFFQIFFDLDRGMLVWTPLMLLSIISLLVFKDKRKWFLLSFVFLNALIYGAWTSWEGAWSFGNRFFLVLFPIYAIGIGMFLQRFSGKKAKAALCVLALYTLFMFCLFMAQRDLIISNTSFFSTIDFWFAQGNLPILFSELIKKISFFRLFFLV